MQSVLLQINLKLLGVDGMVMKSVKQWVLRCSGCFTVPREMGRSFCTKCGNSSLVRLMAVAGAASTQPQAPSQTTNPQPQPKQRAPSPVQVVNEAGQTRVLSERGAPARVKSTNTRGTKYSMPAPQVGDPCVHTPSRCIHESRHHSAGVSAHSISFTLCRLPLRHL